MKFILNESPVAKKRPRFSQDRVYDPQTSKKMKTKFELAKQLRESCLNPFTGPVSAFLDINIEMPKSWSKKRREQMRGQYADCKPDLDNVEKWYYDCLNGIAYQDDKQISLSWTQKQYADKPSILIEINSVVCDTMKEHAITYKKELTTEQLNYIIKKAHRLGLSQRVLFYASQETDDEGTHIYFEVEGPKEKKNELD